jgi:hypothetical protein
MLYGWAMENMIKGCLIKRHGGFAPALAGCKSDWKGHRLLDLALATGIPLNPEQKLLLGGLQAFVIWAGGDIQFV